MKKLVMGTVILIVTGVGVKANPGITDSAKQCMQVRTVGSVVAGGSADQKC